MVKFEYCRIESTRNENKHIIVYIAPDGKIVDVSGKKLTVIFNELGQDGWELVSSNDTYHENRTISTDCVFKRVLE